MEGGGIGHAGERCFRGRLGGCEWQTKVRSSSSNAQATGDVQFALCLGHERGGRGGLGGARRGRKQGRDQGNQRLSAGRQERRGRAQHDDGVQCLSCLRIISPSSSCSPPVRLRARRKERGSVLKRFHVRSPPRGQDQVSSSKNTTETSNAISPVYR
jgi:hypothetical protein